MADLTKSTLPSVALLLATLIIIFGVTIAAGQSSSASSLVRNEGQLVDGILSDTGALVDSLSQQSSLLAVHGKLTDDDVRKELDKFGVKVIKHVDKFCEKYAETVRKADAGRVYGKLTSDDDVRKELEKFDAKVIKWAKKFCHKYAEAVGEAEAGESSQPSVPRGNSGNNNRG